MNETLSPGDWIGVACISCLIGGVFLWAAANMKRPTVMVLLLTLALAVPAHAGNCHVLYRQQAVVQQVVAAYAAPVYYSVGQSVIDDANRTKLAEDIAARVIAGLKAQGSAGQRGTPQDAAGQPGTLGIKAPLLAAKCSRCHSGTDPRGGLSLDGQHAVTDRTFRDVVRMLGTGKNVPKPMAGLIAGLTPAEKGQLTEELLGLEVSGEAPPEPGELK